MQIANVGDGPCEIGGLAIAKGSDAQFSLGPQQVDLVALAPGDTQAITVVFHPVDAAAPHQRSGQLTFKTTDAKQATAVVQLSAYIDVGCSLTVTPASLDFGNVMLNTTAAASVVLGNDGSAACQVSGIALGPGTDSAFTLDAGQALAFTVDLGSSPSISVRFGAFDSAPPHLKTGTLVFKTGNSRMPDASVRRERPQHRRRRRVDLRPPEVGVDVSLAVADEDHSDHGQGRPPLPLDCGGRCWLAVWSAKYYLLTRKLLSHCPFKAMQAASSWLWLLHHRGS